ncbi:uncharacterized protein LOC105788644 [Gossypium raimondii]|uniref:CRAL-TRIO domain-containing protein n=3 Tax=Gossypium TaxID=3633 RepID=A0A0D2RKT1_GOSRA|nr:uncharacterized protein LOC105788644 [Gossypium raimondii]KJB19735.1 hypothetical protein B456_003G117000 [Gossypium raimondii]
MMMGSEKMNNSMEIEDENIDKTKISLMRILVEKQDPSSKEVEDGALRRFLRARDLDVEKASNMFLKYLNWKRNFVPNGSISPSEIRHEIQQNKMFLQGWDKKGRPIALLLAARHFQHEGGVDEFKRFIVYLFDKIITRMPPGQEKFIVIGDLKGWGYANSDIRAYLAALSLVQDYYPERLEKLFVVHAPYIFMTAWKVVYPFIDPKTRKKMIFVDNKSLKSTLLEEIDESQLPATLGGKLELVPIHNS